MNNGGYSICFNEWALDKDIKSELGLLLIISSLTAENGYCFASNKYFSELFGVDEVSISRKIRKLQDKGYITITYEKRGCEITRREIRLTKMLTDDLQKSQSTDNKNVKENNISSNITSDNINTPISPIDENDSLFDEYWKLYTPVKDKDGAFVAKGNKEHCRAKFKELLKKGTKYETIISGLERYLNYCRANGHRSCGAEVFLNKRRFEDDIGESECVDSQRQSNQRKPLGIVAIGNELVKMSNYDESDSIPF